MQKYFNSVADQYGNAVSGAAVAVTLLGGGAATVYSDNGVTVLVNPLTTDSLGNFAFYAADARYSLSISHARIATITITDILLEDQASEIGDLEVVVDDAVADIAAHQVLLDAAAAALAMRLRVDTAAQGLSGPQKTNAKTNVDLNLVDNTADASKPVSTAQATAIALAVSNEAIVTAASVESASDDATILFFLGI